MISPDEDVLSFELYGNKYLVVFFSSDRSDLYFLEDEIYATFRMSLPKYSQFAGYKLILNPEMSNSIASSFY